MAEDKKAREQKARQEAIKKDMAKYLWVKMLTDRNPELRQFWEDVKASIKANGGIQPEEFNNLTRKYNWFTKIDGDRQRAEVAMAQDKANNTREYADSVEAMKPTLKATFAQYGVELDDATLATLADQARYDNWSEAELKAEAGRRIEEAAAGGGDLRGDAGDIQNDLADWARKNGLNLSSQQLSAFVRRGAMGEQSVDDAKAEIRKMYLKGAYPAWSDYIDRGMDPYEIAAPYRTEMANLLEVDPESIGFDDPLMQKAMQGVDDKGQPATVPLWQYKQMVRKDPRWQKTDNAYETYTNVGTELLQMFGFR